MDNEKRTATSTYEESARNEDEQANIATQQDHDMGKLAAIRRNPWAFFWASFGAWQILLIAYENSAAGLVTGIPQFRQDFGFFYNGQWVLPAAWQAAHSGGPIASQVVGALTSGQIADWIGRKYTIMGALVISFASITLQVTATNNPMFFGGKFLNGFAVGTLKTISTTYIGEVAPLPLRGLMTAFIGMGYTVGGLIVALVLNETGTFTNAWAYRAVFISQYGVAGISAILVWFMPESPWWLVSCNRPSDALASLKRLGYADRADERLSEIKRTLDSVRHETEGVTYLECFRQSNLRRTIISILPMWIQSLAGAVFMQSYTLYYAQLAGFSGKMSFKIQVAAAVLSMGGNIVSWFLVDRMGRRLLMLCGVGILMVICMTMGGLAVLGTAPALEGAVSMCLLYSFFYNVGIGAVAFTILAEVSTSRLRAKTIAIALATQSSLNTMWSFTLPYLFNPDRLNLGGRLGFVFGGTAAISLVYLWFYQPETRGRSYAELDELFVKRVGARQFGTYQTDLQEQAARTTGADVSK